jgi:hypothetical protein
VASTKKRRNRKSRQGRRPGVHPDAISESLQRLDREIGAIKSRLAPKPEPQWRPLLFSGLAIATLVASAIIISLIRSGFTTPAPNLSIPGSAKLYMIDGRSGASFPAGADSGITVTTMADQDHNQVHYELDFPPKLSGMTFVMAMVGSAVLRDVRLTDTYGDVQLPQRKFSTEYPDCRIESTGQSALCQTITGEVPQHKGGVTTNDTSLCFGAEKDHVAVAFSGTSAYLNTSLDWAHRVTSMPYLGAHEIDGKGFVAQEFGSIATPVYTKSCQMLTLSPRLEEPQASVNPQLAQNDLMMWSPDESEAVISVVSKERSADWQGNTLLAAIGILVPFFVALVAAAFRSWRRSRPER